MCALSRSKKLDQFAREYKQTSEAAVPPHRHGLGLFKLPVAQCWVRSADGPALPVLTVLVQGEEHRDCMRVVQRRTEAECE